MEPAGAERHRRSPKGELDGRRANQSRRPTTFQEAEKMFCNFPIAETPEELAKVDDDDLGSNENKNGLSPNE